MSIIKFVTDYTEHISNLDSQGVCEMSTLPYTVIIDGETTIISDQDKLETFVYEVLKNYQAEQRYATKGNIVEILYMGKFAASVVVEWITQRNLKPYHYQIGYHLKKYRNEYGMYSDWKVCGAVKID